MRDDSRLTYIFGCRSTDRFNLTNINIKYQYILSFNCLRDLDPAIFRRLEKRIFVDLPDVMTRNDMFEYYLSETLQQNKYIKCEIDSDRLARVRIAKIKK